MYPSFTLVFEKLDRQDEMSGSKVVVENWVMLRST
jgi:hypothetical protein